jgi:hypothetical protein
VPLILDEQAFPIASLSLPQTCGLFADDVTESHDNVCSKLSAPIFGLFVEAIGGADIQITKENLPV